MRKKRGSKGIILCVLAWIGIFVLLFAAVVGISVLVLRAKGKSELQNAAQYLAPALPTEETADEETTYEADDGTVSYHGESYRYNEDILTFLVMGIDNKGTLPDEAEIKDYTQGGQADALFLVVINPHTEQISLIAINRNTMGEVDVYDKDNNYVRTDRLQVCLQHGYGSGLTDSCERQVETISKLFYFLPIQGYVSIEMGAITALNDSVGGVEVALLEQIPKGSSLLRSEVGSNITLTGKDAYYYVQYRDTDVFDSVSLRLARQKQYLQGFITKAVSRTKEDITFPVTMLNELSDYVVTDLNASRVTYLATAYIGYDIDLDHIYSLEGETITGGGGFEEFYADDDALYELIIDLFYEKVS